MENIIVFIGWVIVVVCFLGLIGLVMLLISFIYGCFTNFGRIKVYYDDNDHSKGFYWICPPTNIYPVGYSRKTILADKEEYERLKREQKAKRKISIWRRDPSQRPGWVQFLFYETPFTLWEKRKHRKG